MRAERLQRRRSELASELIGDLIERHRARVLAGEADGDGHGLRPDLQAVVAERAVLLGAGERAEIEELLRRETVGLGPLEELLADDTVEEVLVNGPGEVWVERAGRLSRTPLSFHDQEQLMDVIERILGPLGRRVDELNPMADGRLPDGSRVNVVIPPLAVDGPMLSIRRFTALRPGPGALVQSGAVPAELMEQLREAVRGRRNLLISGGTGSGKTTLLNAVSSFVEPGERVITIEDAAELRLELPHVVRLESRPASVEGSGEVTIRDLVRNALRMRPDRIVIGEVRGAEAMDLIAALNTGHRGALGTVHANSPEDAVRRIETLAMMAGLPLPHSQLRSQLLGALDLVLQLERTGDGARRAACLAEAAADSPGSADAELRVLWQRAGS